MTPLEMLRLEILGNKDNTSLDSTLKLKINEATMLFLALKYPYDYTITTVPTRYCPWLTLCAKELYNKNGKEGSVSYSENGLNITYDQAVSIVSPSLQALIVPNARPPQPKVGV